MAGDSQPSMLEEANAEIARLRAALAANADAAREPIAIIGMGCRYPGDVRTPEEFWELLTSGRDILRDIPGDRWDVDAHFDPEMTAPGKMYVRQGYYLDDIDQFDPQFFGLSPREAESLDPQQRLVMEVAWETLENARIAPSSLKGGKTGVFVGQYWDDYSAQRIYAADSREIDRYAQLSALRGLTAGRICHILDSHGPAIQLDTACSSSSLAVHLACQSLRAGESDLALAGGVSLILAPEHLIGICQMTALSPDGRCKTFDASADGFGQGEGCGIVALKRLSDAQADGDDILAVVQGSAVNHDGHARTVTTPSGAAQRGMLQEALDDAGICAHQVDFVETHGTGTPLGDPIEVSAIARVLCEDREKPLYLGSVKTNVGHLDSAAGVVGLMKVVLSLQHDTIPQHLNYSTPNRHIPWHEWPLKVPTQNTPWAGAGRFAGVSAFGMSGTNVHLIIGEAPRADATPIAAPQPKPAHILTLSTQAAGALPDLAGRYAKMLEAADPTDAEADLTALCASAALGRSHLSQRAAFVVKDRQALASSLAEFAAGGAPAAVSTGVTGRRAPKLAFLFTGQGAQHIGMGKALYQAQPEFRRWMDHCANLLSPCLDRPLHDILWSGDALHQTANTQPALFAIEYSLAKTLEAWGVEPDLLLGHSIGEYAAAAVAGVFSLEDALRLVAARGRLMQSLPSGGKMVSAAADEATVASAIGDAAQVAIAAVNGPRSIVFSGDGGAVDKVAARLAAEGVRTTPLNVSHAFHSPLMDPILDEFRAVAAGVDYQKPTRTLISNVTGKPWDDAQLSADYWVDHLRGAVRFADGVTYAQSKKFQTFVEIGPRPTLLGLGRASVAPDYGVWLPGLRPDDEWETLLNCVAELYVRGVEIDWRRFHSDAGGKRMRLPNYPWRYQRCWTDIVSTGNDGGRMHPLVHRKIDNASNSVIFESTLSAASPAYLDDHRVFGNVAFPASAFFEMAMVVARTIFDQDEVALTNVAIGRALTLTETPVTVQMIATPNGDRYDFEICSQIVEDGDAIWVQHTTGALERRLPSPAAAIDIKATLEEHSEAVDIAGLSKRFEARGLEYFPRFQAIEEIYTAKSAEGDDTGAAFAKLKLPTEAVLPGDHYRLHPVITDASFRIAEAIFPDVDEDHIHLPIGISGFSCDHAASGTVWVKATARQQAQTRIVDLELFDDDGQRVATVDKLTLRSAPVFSLKRAMAKPTETGDVLDEWLYQVAWEVADDLSSDEVATNGDWLLLRDAAGVADELERRLQAQGMRVRSARNSGEIGDLVASGEAQSISGVIHLWCLDACETAPETALLDSLNAFQALTRAGVAAKHWFVTKGAQAVADEDAITPWQTRFWGFARTLQAEHPEQLGACVDLDPAPSQNAANLDLLLKALRHPDEETEIAFRHGVRHVARLMKSASSAESDASDATLELDPEGSYLITGGMGALGLQIAQHLASGGAKHLILTGRSGVSTDDQRTVLQALQDAGVKTDVVTADVSRAEDVARIISMAPRLRGVLHAAGVLDDGMLMQQTADRFTAVAGPKVDGAWRLHQQTADLPLDFFVMFSSVASVMGSPGQSNYASANAFMDGLAHYRRRRGLAATSINWGPWADVGMAASDVVLQRLMKDGWQPMSANQGCAFIDHVLTTTNPPQAAVLPVDWGQFTRQIPGASGWRLLQRLIPNSDAASLATGAAETAAARAKAAGPDGRVDLICAYLLERIAQTLRVPAADLDEHAELSALGVDSLTAVELRIWAQSDLDVDLAVEQLFTAPSIRDLASAIHDLLSGAAAPATVETIGVATEQPRWIVRPLPRPDARLQLICFPYAGGGASAFRNWAEAAPHEIELSTIQMPGREERLAEPLITNMPDLVDALTREVIAFADRPFAFFGHSMGAIVAYEVACRLRDLKAAQPSHLFVSSRTAPQLEKGDDPLRFLENAAFMDRLHNTYGAVPDAIRQSAEMQKIFLPILRADVTLLETYSDAGAAPLSCPISAFGGASDPAITSTMLAGWRGRTEASFTQCEFDGDHFYIHQAHTEVLAEIRRRLMNDALSS